MNLSDIAILKIEVSDYCCIIPISKNEAINLMQNADLTEKWNIIKHKNLLSHMKMGKEIVRFGDIEIKKKITAIRLLFLKDVDIEKVLVSNKISLGGKNYE